jgi:tetratricopeptide (TPR) repeat protein
MLEGDLYLALQQFEDADRAFDVSFELRPTATAALKSYRARSQGRLGQVTSPLTRWLAQSPADFTVRSVLAEAYQLAGQEVRAIQEYETVVRDGPPNAVAFNNLAWLYYLQKDRRAIDMARRAHEAAPGVAAITDTYGWILVENGRAEEGLRLLEEAVKASPEVPDIGYHRAAALARLGRRAEAVRALEGLLADNREFDSRGDAIRLRAELGGT